VSVDLEMAADVVAFSLGLSSFSKENEYMPADHMARMTAAASTVANFGRKQGSPVAVEAPPPPPTPRGDKPLLARDADSNVTRSIVVVCPSRELAYPLGMVKDLGCDTTSADFGQFNTGDILKSAAKWIDLSDSETIWRD
jgi:hypothetical protein